MISDPSSSLKNRSRATVGTLPRYAINAVRYTKQSQATFLLPRVRSGQPARSVDAPVVVVQVVQSLSVLVGAGAQAPGLCQ